MSDAKDIYWCTQHKLCTRPGFLCYLYDVAPGVDAKNTPAKEMRCENCINCHKEADIDDFGRRRK